MMHDQDVDELLADVAATVALLRRCQAGHVPPGEAIESALMRLQEWTGGVV